jgi:hypothetical protein
MSTNESASARIYRCSNSPKEYSKGYQIQGTVSATSQSSYGPRTPLYRMRWEMERIRLIVYRVTDSLSIRNSRFGHQFPPMSVLAESSTLYPNVGEYKGSNDCHYRGLPLSIREMRGKQRITRSLDTTSTPPITTIARLHLCTHNNTISLRLRSDEPTRERLELTQVLAISCKGSRKDFGLIRTYGAPTLL